MILIDYFKLFSIMQEKKLQYVNGKLYDEDFSLYLYFTQFDDDEAFRGHHIGVYIKTDNSGYISYYNQIKLSLEEQNFIDLDDMFRILKYINYVD